MAIDATSIAAATVAGAKNVQFATEVVNVPHKILIIGNYDETTKTDIVEDTLYRLGSSADAADKFGFGWPLHRLAKYAEAGSQSIEMWALPVLEDGGAAASAGSLAITASSAEAGTIHMYIAGEYVSVSVAKDDSATIIGDAIEAAINAKTELPVTAENTTGTVAVTAKSLNAAGDLITLTFNQKLNQELPVGVEITVTAMTGGAGDSDIETALEALGTDDDANEKGFTEVIHGFTDENTLDLLSTYNGIGNEMVGCWAKAVHKPFRSLQGDTQIDDEGDALEALVPFGDGRKTDRTNGIIAVPGSPNHPHEIAALTVGIMAKVNQARPAEHFVGKLLPGILPGVLEDRWTRSYDSRDAALKAGISSTIVEDGAVYLQNLATFYHPDNVLITSNGYRSMVSISKLQNMLYNQWANFAQERWQGNAVVESVVKVSNTADRQKATDRMAVLGDLFALATQFEKHAWVYNASFTINKLKSEPTRVQIRSGTTGFDILMPVILSGEAGIFNNEIEFDTSIAVLG